MASVEDRLDALESEFSLWRKKLNERTNWLDQISGSMKDFPEFEEVVELGREERRSYDSGDYDSEGRRGR